MQSLTIDKLISTHIFYSVTNLVFILLEHAQSDSLTEYFDQLSKIPYLNKKELVPYQFRYTIEEENSYFKAILYRLDSDIKSKLCYQEIPVAVMSEKPELETALPDIVYSSEKLETEGFDVTKKEEIFDYLFDESYQGYHHALIWSEKDVPYFNEYSEEVWPDWVVSEQLALLLTQHDETVIKIPSFDYVWCRTSESDLASDRVLQQIVKSVH
ncbi:MAG: hypothetical protein HC763_26075 [Hydrococcus sp. CRU_1_1]|nr:hypothetical protein [Hydrococcus sp. CRU_1_1]